MGGESLVIGEYSPNVGLPSAFVADLALQDADTQFFYEPDGSEQVLPSQIAVSRGGQWLAFVTFPGATSGGSLWRSSSSE